MSTKKGQNKKTQTKIGKILAERIKNKELQNDKKRKEQEKEEKLEKELLQQEIERKEFLKQEKATKKQKNKERQKLKQKKQKQQQRLENLARYGVLNPQNALLNSKNLLQKIHNEFPNNPNNPNNVNNPNNPNNVNNVNNPNNTNNVNNVNNGNNENKVNNVNNGNNVNNVNNENFEDYKYRAPIVCVMGHVDVGKTKFLDKLRNTNVGENERGHITQQIGATWFPIKTLTKIISKVSTKKKFSLDVPGLLIMDTPGHESFINLRNRGSSLCDIAILVVDIMKGIEKQTIESIKLLSSRKIPFIVALNKIDRIYGWKNNEKGLAFKETYKNQKKNVKLEFEKLCRKIILDFAEQELNANLYNEIKNFDEWIALVPISALSGDGIPDLLLLLTQYSQKKLKNTIINNNMFKASVLEVKQIEGYGKTMDIILADGILKKHDKIVLCGIGGPIVSTIKLILTPQPLCELRIVNEFLKHESVRAAQGVKIVLKDKLEGLIAGSSIYLVKTEEELQLAKIKVKKDYENIEKYLEKSEKGVYVNSSTLGALEAILHFLKLSKIPVIGFSIILKRCYKV